MKISTSGLLEVIKYHHHVQNAFTILQTFSKKLCPLRTATTYELVQVYPALNEALSFSNLLDNSLAICFLFSKSVDISSRADKKLLFRFRKVVVRCPVKLEILRKASMKETAIVSLMLHSNKSSGVSETEYQSPAYNNHFRECRDQLFTENDGTHDTSEISDREPIYMQNYPNIHIATSRVQIGHSIHLRKLLERQQI